MEWRCTLEDFGRPVQPATPNRPRCRAEKENLVLEVTFGSVYIYVAFSVYSVLKMLFYLFHFFVSVLILN